MTKDVALMFPGSGSQYVGMARWLYERYPQVRTLFDEASQITEWGHGSAVPVGYFGTTC